MYIARCSLKYLMLSFFPYLCMDQRYVGTKHLVRHKRRICLPARLQTPNVVVLGDLGRFLINFILKAVRCIKIWLRILRLPEERLTKKAYNMLVSLKENGKKT